MKFKVGDSVVHLSHGVGMVKGIEERSFSPDNIQKFYILEIQDNGAPKKVFVPFIDVESKLRPVIKQSEAKEVYNVLRDETPSDIDHSTWNRRYRNYMELIHTGDIKNIAKVTRDLFILRNEKDLSFGERKLLDHALGLLVKELSIVENKEEKSVKMDITGIFA